jgi:hypothetical protein
MMRMMCLLFLSVCLPLAAEAEVCGADTAPHCAQAGCDGFEALDTTHSKFVEEAQYRAADRCLILTVEAHRQAHCAVPHEIWDGFKKAADPGLYYNLNIAGRFACGPDAGPQ